MHGTSRLQEISNNHFSSPSMGSLSKRIRGNGTTPNNVFVNDNSINSEEKQQSRKYKLTTKKRLALSPILQNKNNQRNSTLLDLRAKNEFKKQPDTEIFKERNNNYSFESTTSQYLKTDDDSSSEAVNSNHVHVTTRRRKENYNEEKFTLDERLITSPRIEQDKDSFLDSSQMLSVSQSIESDLEKNMPIELSTISPESIVISELIDEKIDVDLQFPINVKHPDQKSFSHCYNLSLKNFVLDQVIEQDLVIQDFPRFSHQQILKLYGCNLVSLEDVIIPSIVKSHNYELKKMQSKSQRVKDSPVTKLIKLTRLEIQSSAIRAVQALKDCRVERNKVEEANYLSLKKEERRQRQESRAERRRMKELRAQEKINLRMQRKDDQFRQMKKCWPKNKELWIEVAKLMTDLGIMRKEEKIWGNFIKNVNLDGITFMSRTNYSDLVENLDVEELDSIGISLDDQVDNTIDDMSLAANRINETLTSVVGLMEESDSIRYEVFDKYEKEHKFLGYRSVKNPKTLIRALAFCD